ncbi:MAG: HAMP domain-containing sensor histidine kinase [Patescibacteria group bacterium]
MIKAKKSGKKTIVTIEQIKGDLSHDLSVVEQIKENFLIITAHQLKTPLNIIKINLQMILRGELGSLNQQVKRTLLDVFHINHKVIELVSDFLNASEIETGRIRSHARPVNISKIFHNVIDELDILAHKKKLKINLHTKPSHLPQVMVNSHRLREIIYNLISNAIKYNRANGRVEVTVKKLKNKIHISVADTGIGISAKDQKRLFSKFFRGQNAIRIETQGSGLGLYIVKSYVESLGGKIWFKSKDNIGSTFYVEIPLVK